MRSTLFLLALSPLALAQTTSTSTTTSWWTATSTKTLFRVKAAATGLSNTLTENVNGMTTNTLTELINGATSLNTLTEMIASNATASAVTSVFTEAIAAGSGSNATSVLTELIASATNAPSSAVTVAVQGQGSNAPFRMPNATSTGLVFGVKGTGTGATPARFTGAAVRANSVSEFGGFSAMVLGALYLVFL